MSDIDKNSILVILRLSKPGNRRKVPSGMVAVDADSDSVSVAKELLDCKELADIAALDGTIRRWIYTRCLPSGVLKEGVYRLPIVLIDEVDQELVNFRTQRQNLINTFLQVYPEKSLEARNRLRVLYDASDYPSVDAIRDSFDMQWRYLALDIPQALSASLVERERKKAASDVAAEFEEIRIALRKSFADLVQHAASSLAVDQTGKPRIFRDSLITNMEQFLAYFNARNITNDSDLAALVEQARAVLHNLTPEELRTQIDVRAQVRDTFTQIKQRMDDNRMLKPARRFAMEPTNATV